MSFGIAETSARIYEAATAAMHAPSNSGENMELYGALAQLGDLDEVPGELIIPPEIDGFVTMSNVLELIVGLEIASTEFGIYNDHDAILKKAEHESQHAGAINALGMSAVHALRFKQLASGNLGMKATTVPTGGPVTKLGFASAIAHPRQLSNSDARKLKNIGYPDARDVASRIRQTGAKALLPLSAIDV